MSAAKRQVISVFLLICIVLTLAFIWGNSLLDRQSSTELSTGVLDFLKPILKLIGINTETDHALRKIAHFCEFGLLGVELTLFAFLHKGAGIKAMLIPAVFCLFVAVSDETIQFFSGRACQVTDMLLDFSGSVCGIVGIWVLSRLCSKKTVK